MPSRLLLSRAAAIALRALVELAREPGVTLSVTELARRQRLPQPMLEQILLRLRRDGLVEARRGRHGGYRLAQQAETLPLARVLQAVEPSGGRAKQAGRDGADGLEGLQAAAAAADGSPNSLEDGSLPEFSRLEQGWPGPAAVDAALPGDGRAGGVQPAHLEAGSRPQATWLEPVDNLGASAGHRVEQQLRRRLERLVQLELQRLTLAELLYDQRSWEASLGPEGGVMLS